MPKIVTPGKRQEEFFPYTALLVCENCGCEWSLEPGDWWARTGDLSGDYLKAVCPNDACRSRITFGPFSNRDWAATPSSTTPYPPRHPEDDGDEEEVAMQLLPYDPPPLDAAGRFIPLEERTVVNPRLTNVPGVKERA